MNFIKLNSKKRPMTKFNPLYYKNSYELWNNVGFIIGNDIIVLDFDNDNINEKQITDYIENKYPTLIVKTTRGKHFYYKMPPDYQFKKQVDCLSCLGFQCDYLTGEKCIATIKLNGKLRDMNREFNVANIPFLPEELYPLRKAKKLSGMKDGDGRNNSLYAHLLSVREQYPQIDINELANTINTNMFVKKLETSELNELVKSAIKKNVTIVQKKGIKYSNMNELQNKNLPPIIFYIDNFIPQGLTILCSLPKMGKSWMALDMGLSISMGTPFMGFNTQQSKVLYLALEDSENRLQTRTNKLLNGKIAPIDFLYAIQCDDISNGLIEELEEIKEKEPNVKVIIIDTLQKVRGMYRGSNNYANDYKELSEIKSFADKYNMAIVVIHHMKKGYESDSFNKVSGTNGITGTVDTMITMEKDNRANETTLLSINGRDVEYNQYIIRFNPESCKWEMVSTYEENKQMQEEDTYYNDPLVYIIKNKLLKDNNLWRGTYKEVSALLQERFSDCIDTKVNSSRIKPLLPLLKKYDEITFFTDKHPRDGKRFISFFRKPVEFVESVESVESINTNNTNSTNNTERNV